MAENYATSNSPSMADIIRQLSQTFLKAKKKFRATGLSGVNAHQKYKYAKKENNEKINQQSKTSP